MEWNKLACIEHFANTARALGNKVEDLNQQQAAHGAQNA